MKATIRIPTHEYAYIEVDVLPDDIDLEGTTFTEEVVKIHGDLKELVKKGGGVNNEFADYIKKIFDGNLKDWGQADAYEERPSRQKDALQSIKRYTKRKHD